MRKFKILALDGGGVRGIISANILIEVEKVVKAKFRQELWECFDMVAGTSTGSLIAALIARKKRASEIARLYEKMAIQVFPEHLSKTIPHRLEEIATKIPFFGKQLAGAVDAVSQLTNLAEHYEYGNEPLIKLLQKELGEYTSLNQLADDKKPIVIIPAYNIGDQLLTVFTNFGNIGDDWYGEVMAWEACLASASAPVFLPRVQVTGQPMIDGGVAANDPALLAMTKALQFFPDLNLEDITVVSIGTGNGVRSFSFDEVSKWTPLNWAANIPQVFMEPTGKVSEMVLETLLNKRSPQQNYLRLNFDLNTPYPIGDDPYGEFELKNRYTGVPLSEAIDDANPQTLDNYVNTVKEYIKQEEIGDRISTFFQSACLIA